MAGGFEPMVQANLIQGGSDAFLPVCKPSLKSGERKRILFARSHNLLRFGGAKLCAAAFRDKRQRGMCYGQRSQLPFERRSNQRAASAHESRLQRIARACAVR